MGEERGEGEEGKADRAREVQAEAIEAGEGICGGEEEEEGEGVVAGVLGGIDLGDGAGHERGGEEGEARVGEDSADVEEDEDGGDGEDRGEGADGKRAGAEEVHPPAEEDVEEGRMGVAVHVGPDVPPGGGVGDGGEVWGAGFDDAFGETVVDGAAAGGHFDGPDFVHPEAGGGDLAEAEEGGGEKDNDQAGDV